MSLLRVHPASPRGETRSEWGETLCMALYMSDPVVTLAVQQSSTAKQLIVFEQDRMFVMQSKENFSVK